MCIRALLILTILAVAVPASAQTPPTSEGLGGPVVPGVCLLSREAVFANSAVGQAATARLTELTRQAQAEVEAERQPIEVEAQAFQADAAGLSPEARQSRQQALATRLQAVQAKVALRGQEIDATRQTATSRIAAELQPVIAEAYGARNCGLLLDRNTALGGNFINDLTEEVIQKLNERLQTLTFDREILSTQSASENQ